MSEHVAALIFAATVCALAYVSWLLIDAGHTPAILLVIAMAIGAHTLGRHA